MKLEIETPVERQHETTVAETMAWPEPQSAWGAELLVLLKAVDESGIPKLSVEEIEEYLERSPGPACADESVRQIAA